MFHPSSQHISFRQQIISLNQGYPCPRCPIGSLEVFGLTETLKCDSCERSFVPLKSGRFLYPANQLGWKIAPTFWWDGFRWHRDRTTASTKQLTIITLLSLVPVLAILVAAQINPHWWTETVPKGYLPALFASIAWLFSLQLIYLSCWDFDFYSLKNKRKVKS
jgi:hypothetical protein